MRLRRTAALALILAAWLALAALIQNEILLPSPVLVAQRMLGQLLSPAFYRNIAITAGRMLEGLALALVLGLASGLLSGISEKFRDWFYPVEMIAKTVPNISYIIIALIWLGSEKSVIVVSFLVLFPVFYANMKGGVQSIDRSLTDVLRVYPVSFARQVFQVYLPLCRSSILAALETALGLGFKVSVMAEIIGRVQSGVGFQIDFCRVNLDMVGVFAWTCWIVILAAALDRLFRKAG